MDESRLYALLERIAAALRADEWAAAKAHGLQPVHLHVLHYLSQCNRYSDTPAAVTTYLGATKGTVSQTLLVLEARGLIEKQPDPADRRQVRLGVTKAGALVLDGCIPPPLLRNAVGQADNGALEPALEILLAALQRANDNVTFGMCRSCTYFREGARGGENKCGLTGEPLSEEDSRRICREHSPRQAEAT